MEASQALKLHRDDYKPAIAEPEQLKTEWTFKEFAEKLGVAPTSIRKIIQRNKLPDGYEVKELSERKKVIRKVIKPLRDDLSKEQIQIAYARYELLKIWKEYRKKYKEKQMANLDFENDYNELHHYPGLYAVLGEVSIKTLYRWKNELNGDPLNLAPNFSGGRESTISKTEEQALLSYFLLPNQLKNNEVVRQAVKVIESEGIKPKSERTYLRWLRHWKERHYDVFLHSRYGTKALNDKNLPNVVRDYNSIEVGDVLVIDGHVLNFEIINPATGKPKRMMMVAVLDAKSDMVIGWEIMPTENVYAITSALRRAVMFMSIRPRLVYIDNGRANKSKAISGGKWYKGDQLYIAEGAIERLGAKVQTAKPYHGQSKPVERWFASFGEMERLMPTYSGYNIESKPARMMRNEKLHKRLYEQSVSSLPNKGITIYEAHERIAQFIYEYMNRLHTSGRMKGRTSLDVYKESFERVQDEIDFHDRLVDESELRLMMMSEEIRTLGTNGIRFMGKEYWNDTFYSMEKAGHKAKLYIRYDIGQPDVIHVYTTNGKYLGEAVTRDKVHFAAKHLGTDNDVKKLNNQLKHIAGLRKQTEADTEKYLRPLLLPTKEHQESLTAIEEREKQKRKKQVVEQSKQKQIKESNVLTDAEEDMIFGAFDEIENRIDTTNIDPAEYLISED